MLYDPQILSFSSVTDCLVHIACFSGAVWSLLTVSRHLTPKSVVEPQEQKTAPKWEAPARLSLNRSQTPSADANRASFQERPSFSVTARRATEPGRNRGLYLVPVNLDPVSTAAAELAFGLAGTDEEVVLLHLVPESPQVEELERLRLHAAKRMLANLRRMGQARGVATSVEILPSTDFARSLHETVKDREVQTLVMGTRLQGASDTTVERVARLVTCELLVLNALH